MQPTPIATYCRQLKPLLPREVFAPARSRLLWLPTHLSVIVAATLALASGWGGWPLWPLLSLLIGTSFAGLTFLGHETLHGAVLRGRYLPRMVGFIGFLPFVVSPRLWVAWHNRVHHGSTNRSGADPDAYPTLAEYRDDRAVQIVTDCTAPGRRRLRGLVSLLIGFSVQSLHMLLVAGKRGYLTPRQHRLALLETALGVAIWGSLAWLIGATPFVFAFLLPLLVANTLVMAHILTNHSLSPLTIVNDPLSNSLTVTVPRWFEWLTLGFGYHVEHHLFPSMSARYGAQVRDVVRKLWPDRYQSLPLSRALLSLHRSPRIYKDDTTLMDPHTGREWKALGPGSTIA